MPVYLINSYNIHDFDTFQEYPPKVAVLLPRYGAKVLAMETNSKTLEGKAKTMTSILEFPSEEAIQTMYRDPEYQAVIHLRHNSTSDCSMTILNAYQSK